MQVQLFLLLSFFSSLALARIGSKCSSDAECEAAECCTQSSISNVGSCWYGSSRTITEGRRCTPPRTDGGLPFTCPVVCGDSLECNRVQDPRFGLYRKVSVCVKKTDPAREGTECMKHTDCHEHECCKKSISGFAKVGVCSPHTSRYLKSHQRCDPEARSKTPIDRCPVECGSDLVCSKTVRTSTSVSWISNIYDELHFCLPPNTGGSKESSGDGDVEF